MWVYVLSRCMRPFSWWNVISCEYAVILTSPCWYTDILQYFKKQYTWKKYTIATRVKQKMATSDEDAAHSSAIQVCFSSGLTPIDPSCQLKSTECYKNVSKAPAYTWHGRFCDGSKAYSHLVGGRSIRIAE